MARGLLLGMSLGLLMLFPVGAVSWADDYDANLCEPFSHNADPAFSVPTNGQHRMTIDLRHCGGLVQNYQVTLMSAKRSTPYATLTVLDQDGHAVGVSDPGHHLVYIGSVPSNAVYTVVVTSGSRHTESCLLNFTGAI